MRFWLTATHLKSQARCRLEVGAQPLVVGRAVPGQDSTGKLSIDFDPMLSRNHFEVRLQGNRLSVRRLESKHPLYLKGAALDEFEVESGQHFTSGQTSFVLTAQESSLGEPTRANTMMVDLHRLREMDANRCLTALLDLQPLLASGHEPGELLRRALPILGNIVPMASGLLLVQQEGEQWTTVASRGVDGQITPSRTLLRQALDTQESVCFFWDRQGGPSQATLVADVRWAVAAPIRTGTDMPFVLYAVGSESHITPTSSGRTPGDLDRAVLTFVAGVFSQHLEGRWAALQVEEERRQRFLAERLRQVIEDLSSTLEPEAILSHLQGHLRRWVSFESSRAWLAPDVPSEYQGLEATVLADSGLILPVRPRSGLAAVVELTRSQAFRPDEQSLAWSLCSQAAVALENAQMYKTVERLATLDELTQVSNRRHFFRQAQSLRQQTSESGDCFAVLLMDVDHFKRFNDTFGHQVGDRVLQTVASAARPFFEIFGRYGGEEFAAVAPQPRSQAMAQAEALRQAVEALEVESAGRVTISLGVALCSQGKLPLETLLARADEALYEAKRAGRNQVCLHWD